MINNNSASVHIHTQSLQRNHQYSCEISQWPDFHSSKNAYYTAADTEEDK